MPRAVRRPRTAAALAGMLLVGTAGCAGIGQPDPYESRGINGLVIPTPSADPADFVDGVDNPWLSLEPGASWHYDVTGDGRDLGTIDVEVEDATTEVAGLAATLVRTTSEIAGAARDVDRLYAQDEQGNVWLVGADSDDGSWRAGVDGAEAGLAMPAIPRLGDGWLAYSAPGTAEASIQVEEQSAEMLQMRETGTRDEADTRTRTVYESGVGLVSVEDLDAGWVALLAEQP